VFIPKKACWLNLQEGWWRLFRRQAWPANASPTPARSPSPRGLPRPS
jgi:hypothetical protein